MIEDGRHYLLDLLAERGLLKGCLEPLSELEVQTLTLRFGLGDYPVRPLPQVAFKLGLTRQHTREIIGRAFEQILALPEVAALGDGALLPPYLHHFGAGRRSRPSDLAERAA